MESSDQCLLGVNQAAKKSKKAAASFVKVEASTYI